MPDREAICQLNQLLRLDADGSDLYRNAGQARQSLQQSLARQREYFDHGPQHLKPLPMTELQLKTHYERMHLAEGRKIKYVRFGLG